MASSMDNGAHSRILDHNKTSTTSTSLQTYLTTLRTSFPAVLQDLTVGQCLAIAVLVTPLLLAFSPKSMFRQALYPVQLFFLVAAFFAPLPPDQTQADKYNAGLVLGTWGARIIDRVYMHQPEQTFLREGIDDKPGAGPVTYGPFQKGLWGLELITAARGIGWNWQVGGIPKPEYETRRGFVIGRLTKWLVTFALIHLVAVLSTIVLAEHAGEVDTHDDFVLGKILFRNSWFLRVFMTVGWLTVVYGHISLPENLLAIVLVGTGLGGRWSDPKQWPPAFGNIKDSYSLRRCWGKYWHAALRRSTNAPGEWLLQTFPSLRRPKSKIVQLLRRYGLLFLAFAVSGLIHASGSYMVTRDVPDGPSDGGAFKYFLAQPMGILMEDIALNALGITDREPGLLRRYVGYAYVGAFWFYTFPHLKVMPLASAHGLEDDSGMYMAGIRACKELAEALPFNPARSLLEAFSGAPRLLRDALAQSE